MKNKFTYSEEEIKELINGHYHRIIAYIRKSLGKQTQACDAEDIFHDAICQFIERKAELSVEKAPAYLFRIVRNRTLNHITRNKVDRHSVHNDDFAADAWNTLAMLDYEGTMVTNERIIETIGIEDVIGHHETFTPRMREIFYSSRIEGLTNREIAEKLHISTRAVEQYLQQSVAEYRRFYGLETPKSKSN